MLLSEFMKRITQMGFPARLAALRKERGLSQVALAAVIGVHVNQVRRYEAGRSQPTLEVIRKMAQALRVTADLLIFDANERGPDDEFRLQFEALTALGLEERKIVREVLDALLLKHDVKRWAAT
ncbi:MAG: hypothetical protein FD126_2288 [Elusimicrobia bacterium]|nr:MAG: hypothetical protein FD126_2288 [Elusimicrobiota bacterium]